MSFSCGAALQDAEIPEVADIVYFKKMHCHEPTERLYYTADFKDICVHCGAEVSPWSNKELYYPQCEDCAEKPKIPNAKKVLTIHELFLLCSMQQLLFAL